MTPEAPDEKLPRPKIPNRNAFLREFAETLLLIISIYTLVNLATARFIVDGLSMFPSFEGNEYLIVSRFDYLMGEPERGDIVVFHYPQAPDRDFIKRVIGLPGDHIHMENGQVFVNGEPISEPYINELCGSQRCEYADWYFGEDEYFVLGDNRNNSQDSTAFGPIGREYIIGRAWIRYWPPESWGIITHHNYTAGPQLNITPSTVTPTPLYSATPRQQSTAVPFYVPTTPAAPIPDGIERDGAIPTMTPLPVLPPISANDVSSHNEAGD